MHRTALLPTAVAAISFAGDVSVELPPNPLRAATSVRVPYAIRTRSDLLPHHPHYQLTSDTDRYVGYMTVTSVT